MKKLLSASIAAATIAGFAAPAAAVEGLSANAGFVSDYYYRGANLGDAGAYAGVDYETGGFYAGVWAIDDATGGNDGLEYDVYLGYGMDLSEDLSLSAGFTSYQYTYGSNFENEVNLGLAFGAFGLDVAVGNADNGEDGAAASDQDYTFVALSWGGDVFGATVGMAAKDESESGAEDDSDYTYVELSAGGEVSGIDVGVSLGRVVDSSNGDALIAAGAEDGSGDYYMYLDVSKSFDL